MENIYAFPEPLHDDDFEASFLGDLAIARKQLADALGTNSDGATVMSETLSAMHMLRGAAGAIDFKLAFDFAETFHRVAEVGQGFAVSKGSDYKNLIGFLKEAEALFDQIERDVELKNVEQSSLEYIELVEVIRESYGDYFKSDNDSSPKDKPELPTQPAEDLDSFLAMVEADQPAFLEGEQEDDDNEDGEVSNKLSSLGPDGDEPAEWDVLQYFYQEIDENLTAFEQALLALEKGDTAARNEVLRLTHSTKGAANSMGMFRIATLMHETEALFEHIEAESLHLHSSDYSIILKTTDLIRTILQETQKGESVYGLAEQLEAHLNLLPSLGSTEASNAVSETRLSEPKQTENHESAAIDLNDTDIAHNATANTFRIEAEKVDGLLNTVGELIISRTRLGNKMDELIDLCYELTKSRIRMRDTLNTFAERFEYTKNGRRRVASKESGNLDQSGDFAPLEMDRYDEFNILSRQITEIGDDTDLAIREILRGGREVQRESTHLGGYISQIQDEIASTRLAPIVVLYKRIERSVRDAAIKSGREVELLTTGDDLLLDKSILDDLFHPMLHIVRNSVVHGFTDAPESKNKISIQARQQGGRILISVSDNGCGLDFARIRQVAEQSALLDAASADDAQLVDLIFRPGFTTTEVANEVAGRGIGLDAVRSTIEGFGGSIEVQSEQDVGTTFSLHLPLTLAIDRGMYFYVGDQLYAIFMAAVEQVYFSSDLTFEQSGGKEIVFIEGESSVPVIDLRTLFEVSPTEDVRRESIILCRYLNNRVALKVDRVFYQDDVVVKSLGPFFENHRYFSSATIYGDGEVVPIIDISRLEGSNDSAKSEMSTSFELIDEIGDRKEPRILVVDDSLSVRKVCEDYLSKSGYLVETANDGLEALNKTKTTQYDLILSDLEMPRLNGLDLMAELKRNSATSSTPILIITSRTTAKHQEKAMALGARECIGKPFSREQLLQSIENHLLQAV